MALCKEWRDFMNEYIYMDNAATTQLNTVVFEEMKKYLLEYCGNPSSIYHLGLQSKQAIDEARLQIGKMLHASNKEIYFTSGGTESNNWAIRGILRNKNMRGKHLITSKIEHKSVLNTFKALEKEGYKATYLDVNKDGTIDLNQLEKSIKEGTVLISIMLANNETGVIQDIKAISKLIKDKEIIFHTDAVQGVGKLDLDVNKLGVDLLSLSAHKFHGPKGIGALYIRKGTDIENILFGGAQERGLRPGTENIASIRGMSKALTLAKKSIDNRNKIIKDLEKYMIDQLKKKFDHIIFNGIAAKRLPGYINIAIKDISNESLLMNLDLEKICVSSGSACTSGSIKQSHVIKAMGLDKSYAVIRFSLNEENTKEEIDYVIEKMKIIINRLS